MDEIPDQKKRKWLSSAQKVEILREHFKNKMLVSELCNKYAIHPTQFYKWEKQFFENAVSIFELKKKSRNEIQPVIREQQKIQKLHGVIVELTQENLDLKKKWTGSV